MGFLLLLLLNYINFIGSWKIQPFSFPNGVTVGQRVSTICSTSGGRRLSFEWLKDGKSIKDITHIKILSMSDLSTITIEPVSESDSGNYTCVANSEGVTDKYIATLNVYGKICIFMHNCIYFYYLFY